MGDVSDTDDVEVLLKRLSDVERILHSAEKRVEGVCLLADTIIEQEHCETEVGKERLLVL